MTDVAVVISTCDKYSVLWPPFVHGFQKFWPDCPWPIRWVTNYLDAPLGEAVKTGDHSDWSRTSIAALTLVEADVILWIHEDNWLTEPISTPILLSLAALFNTQPDLNNIRLSNCYMSTIHKGDQGVYKPDTRLRVICQDSTQRCSLQPSFWRREAMLAVIRLGETPWVFEGEAPLRARTIPGVHVCCREGFYPLRFLSHVDPAGWGDEAMRRGKWTDAAKKYAIREDLTIDFSVNPDGTAGWMTSDL